jgi:uncharacterized YkwD family protein
VKLSLKRSIITLLAAVLLFSAAHTSVLAFGEGTKGPDVFAVQGMLKSLGYYPGKIDGVYGPQLTAGVRYFQKTYGLSQTGAVNNQTLQSILWAYGNLKIPKAPKQPAKQPDKQGIPQLSADEQRMVSLVNQERNKQGLKPLTADLELSRVARIKSKDMIDQDYFSHQSPTYGSPFEMMKKFGIAYRTAGENIACNQSVEAAHKALMDSPGHRENILKQEYTHVGIGIVNGGVCGKMFTQMFVGK